MLTRRVCLCAVILMTMGCDVSRDLARDDRYLHHRIVFEMPLSDVLDNIRRNEWACDRPARTIEIEPVRREEARIAVMAAGWAGERTFYLIDMRQTVARRTLFEAYVPPGIADSRARAAVDTLLQQIADPSQC